MDCDFSVTSTDLFPALQANIQALALERVSRTPRRVRSTHSTPGSAMRERLVDNRYQILSRIGQGAMGRVLKAEHVYTKRPVALKIIHPQFQESEAYRVRFLREIELACRVQHPNAVQILDAGEGEDGTLYMAMELLNGVTLSHVLKTTREGLPLYTALHIANQVAQALEAVHAAGLIHRDLKPDNVMVMPGPDGSLEKCTAKILDFGIAHDVDTIHSLTGEGMIGTPKFMSPEQTRGEKLTRKSDIYNLGLILFAMLTGKEPFKSDSPVGYVFHHNMTLPPLIASVREDVPASVEWAIQKALSKDPKDRFESADEFMSALGLRDGTPYDINGPFGINAPFDVNAPHDTRIPPRLRPTADRPPVAPPPQQDRWTAKTWTRAMLLSLAGALSIFALTITGERASDTPAFAEPQEYGETPPIEEPPVYAELGTDFNFYEATASDTIVITPMTDMHTSVVDDLSEINTDVAPKVVEPEVEVPETLPAPEPVQEAPTPALATQEPSEAANDVEEDPNVRYRTNVREQYYEEHGGRPIEENSNIRRLREQQREERAKQLAARTNPNNTLPKVAGGVNALRSQIQYPPAAAAARVMGTVGVRVLIDENGKIIAEEITQSLGHGCDEEVLRVLREAAFEPARIDDKPVKAWLNLQFSFQLVG